MILMIVVFEGVLKTAFPAAYPVPPSATNSAINATTIAGLGAFNLGI
jgi:hypothetical protein